jgi:hypothetical protein
MPKYLLTRKDKDGTVYVREFSARSDKGAKRAAKKERASELKLVNARGR